LALLTLVLVENLPFSVADLSSDDVKKISGGVTSRISRLYVLTPF